MDQYIDAFRKYAVFSGRATRKEYWMFTLFNLLAYIILNFVLSPIKLDFLSIIYGLATLIPSLAIGVRRLHDTGRTGWWLLLNLIPFLGTAVVMVFLVLDSQTGTNIYGPNPKGDTYVAKSAKGWAALVIGLHVLFVVLFVLFIGSLLIVFGSLNKARIDNNSKMPAFSEQVQESIQAE
jgi:uncharacterized membrane protein YhaH (DUF805 family)